MISSRQPSPDHGSILVAGIGGSMSTLSIQEPKDSEEFSLSHQKRLQRPHKEPKKPRKRHGARNQHRHKSFVKWLLDTFDLEESRSTTDPIVASTTPSNNSDAKIGVDDSNGSTEKMNKNEEDNVTNASCDSETNKSGQQKHKSFGAAEHDHCRKPHILDVAGGKGEVSARLTMCHQQRVIMVDPRPADVVDCFERIVLPKIPNKWQRRLQERRENNPNFIRDTVDSRFQQLVTTFDHNKTMIEYNKDIDWHSFTRKAGFRPDHIQLPDLIQLQDAIKHATLIVGLHADGATEAIVDCALKYHKPFVVVPCCVFPNFFPMRTISVDLQDGNPPQITPVRTWEQFCTYLLRKDPRFVREELPFEGRNIAIWWDGK